MTIGDDVGQPRARIPRRASSGASPAGLNELAADLPDGSVKAWGSKEIVYDIPPGTVCVPATAAAAATAIRIAATPRSVLAEVRDGLLSAEAARERYGVAIAEDGRSVDEAATARLRGAAS